MQATRPHYLLYSEASTCGGSGARWKFVLQPVGHQECFAAADCEPSARASRLELLAVVRGLEALDQPSRVTLVTRSRYVRRGIRREINHWRDRRWRWERFGQLVPIRDHDLWQRIDRALEFHQVECRGSAMPTAWRAHASLRKHGHFEQWPWHTNEQPLLLVPRTKPRRLRRWSLADTLSRLGQGVLTPISAIWRPPFTRAA